MANGATYTPDDDATIIRIYSEFQGRHGWAIAASKAIGRSAGTITQRKRMLAARGDFPSFSASDDSAAVQEWVAKREANEADPLAHLLSAFAPIEKPAPPDRPVVFTASPCALHLCDFHWPNSNKAAEAIAIEAVKRLRPETVFLNGDLWDCMAISKYDKDMRPDHHWTLQEEADAGANFLYLLEDAVAPFGGKIQATYGNHEERWWKYLSKNAGEIMGMKAARELLAFRRWWVPEWSRLEFMEEDTSYGDLLVTHGDIVRQKAAYSAAGMAAKYHASLVHGHTHRVAFYSERVPAIAALGRGDAQRQVYEGGCMADLQPVYAKKPNWANAMLIMRRCEQTGHVAVEPVVIHGDVAVSSTLGGTIAA